MERRAIGAGSGQRGHVGAALDTEIELEVIPETGGSNSPTINSNEVVQPNRVFQSLQKVQNYVGISSRLDGRPPFEREANDLLRASFWVVIGISFGAVVWLMEGLDAALEYWTCYVVEQSLSVDNLFVFLLIFSFFRVPRDLQETALYWGIVGACFFRGLMVVIGEALVHRFKKVNLFFAGVLLYSAYKIMMEGDDDGNDSLEKNKIIQFVRKLVPVTDRYHGKKFFVKENGILLGTPLFVVLACIELSDVVFAMDSVPAVLGISSRTFVVYSSNIAAILGLRSMFFVISDAIAHLRFLKHSLSIMLAFVGLKIVATHFEYELNTLTSLAVVILVLGIGVCASLLFPGNAASSTSTDEENRKANSSSV